MDESHDEFPVIEVSSGATTGQTRECVIDLHHAEL